MENTKGVMVDFKTFRKTVVRTYKRILGDLKSRETNLPVDSETLARVTLYRILIYLATGCRDLLDIPDFRKSPSPFMQNIRKWVRENPPHARRYFGYCDLFEPKKQPYLWRIQPSDEVLREALSSIMELEPSTWPPNWPGAVYPYLIDATAKRTLGGFYTPQAVVKYIVHRGIGHLCYRSPDRMRNPRNPDEILSIKVLDPAMGDGRFLLEVMDYICEAISMATGERPSPELRLEVARNCIYGVDRDPMVVDVARVGIWLHIGATETDTSFLRHKIRVGDSLLGATLENMEKSMEDIVAESDQLTLFKPEFVPEEPTVPLRKVLESGRMTKRVRSLAHLWTSINIDNPDALELFSHARASISRASDERWADFEAHPAMQRATEMAKLHYFLHYELRFPEVFLARGEDNRGFDAVIGNPPYLRERGSGENALSRMSGAAGEWTEGKMNLLALFIHRGLDLLARGGHLSYITSSYWLQAEGARMLRRRLMEKERAIEFVDLGGMPLFSGATGRHCIMTVAHGVRHPNPARVVTVKPELERNEETLDALQHHDPGYFTSFEVADQRSLLDENGDLYLGDREVEVICRRIEGSGKPLRDMARSSQGIVDNPPEISERTIRKLKSENPEAAYEMELEPGEEVFLLSPDHPLVGKLDEAERGLLRPFYKASSIRQFGLPAEPDAYLIYSTSKTAPDIDRYPNLKEHLERFRPVMEMRREVKQGRLEWWHLHWSRDSKMFEKEHLIIPQMVETPTAAMAGPKDCSGMSTHVVAEVREVSLRFIEAVLNSRAVAFLLDDGKRAKRRGKRLDITLATLRKIPIPSISPITGNDVKKEVDSLMDIYDQSFDKDRK